MWDQNIDVSLAKTHFVIQEQKKHSIHWNLEYSI